MKSPHWLAYLSLTGAMVTVGSTIVASKMMGEMPVFIAAFLRFLIASPVLLALVWLTGSRLPRLRWREWATLCLQAGLGSVGYSVVLMLGLALTQASDASVIAGTLPAVAAVLSWILLRERLGSGAIVAISLATLGVGMLSIGDDAAATGSASARWAGNALVLLAMAYEALFLLLNKTIKTPIPPLVVAAAMSVLSMLLCLVPALVQFAQATGPVFTTQAVGATLYYALVPTVLGFYLWYWGASKVSGSEAALFTAVYPVAALLLSAAVLGETIHVQHWLGAAITVAGIAVGASASPAKRTVANEALAKS